MKKCVIFPLIATASLLAKEETKQPAPAPDLSYNLFGGVLFLQPNGSNLYYAAEAVPNNPALADPLLEANWFEHEISPAYHPAFEVGASFGFHNMEMNLVLDYERLSGTDRKQISVESGVAMVGPLFDIGPDAEIYTIGKGKAHFRFDMADVYLEKQFYKRHHWEINLLFGASFARIKQYMRTDYFSEDGSTGRVIKAPSLFMGAGPLTGFSFDFQLVKHFHLVGLSSISLLMGELQNRATYRSYSPSISAAGNPEPTTERSKVPNRTQLIPGFEEKIGFLFDVAHPRGRICFEAGYLFQIFLNAVQTYDMNTIVTVGLPFSTSDGYYAQGFHRTLSNFILTGPYLNLSVSF